MKVVSGRCELQNELEYFAINTFNNKYKCLELRNASMDHCQAKIKLVREHIKFKYEEIAHQYRPEEICYDIEK